MNFASAINFSLAATNLGVMIWAIHGGSQVWWLGLGAAVFCFCIGVKCLD